MIASLFATQKRKLTGEHVANTGIKSNRAADPLSPGSNGVVSDAQDIKFDQDAGSIRVRDPRLIRTGHRAFCRRLVELLARREGAHKAEIDLASATCQVDFGQGSTTTQGMANEFAEAVREAAGSPANGQILSWWSLGGSWVKLTAYRLQDDVSVWETLDIQPGRIRIRNRRLATRDSARVQLVDALTHRDGVESCQELPWSDALTIIFRPDSLFGDQILDEVHHLFEDVLAAEAKAHGTTDLAGLMAVAGPPKVATGSERIRNLVLAGGTFVLTGVALVVPGIPLSAVPSGDQLLPRPFVAPDG